MRLSRMKGVFQFKLLCWHFICLANEFMSLVLIYMTAHNTLIRKQHKERDHTKALIGIEPFGEVRKPY